MDEKMILTVGDIRAALADAPDERTVLFQVVGTDGSAWNLCGRVAGKVPHGTIAAVTLSHPYLRSMPRTRYPWWSGPEAGADATLAEKVAAAVQRVLDAESGAA